MDKIGLTSYNQYIRRKWFILLCMAVLLFLSAVASLSAGSASLSIGQILRTLFGGGNRQENAIIWNVRMPRVATATVVGMALALSGCVMQNVLRNPLASASTLGVSQGASFGAAVAIVYFGAGIQVNAGGTASALTVTNPAMVTLCAFLGGIATTAVI